MWNPRAFARAVGWLRAGSHVFSGVCLLFVLTNLIAALVLASLEPKAMESYPEYMYEALAVLYPDLSKAERDQLMRERMPGTTSEILAQPREAAISGDYVNVDAHGFRHGTDQGPWPPSDEFFNIFVLGSSTAFGYGVADRDTISSYLQAELARLALPREPRIYNFARAGFYSTQERLLFSKLLALGKAPDLAIFVDGLGDFFIQSEPPPWAVASTRTVTEKLAHPWRTALSSLAIVRLRERKGSRWAALASLAGIEPQHALAPVDDPAMHDRVIRRYVSNKRIVEALASAYGVDVAFVWQPIPTYKYDLSHHLYPENFGRHRASGFGYPRMADFARERPLGENFLWCADIQEGVEELLYVDSVHYSPRMSALLARCIADLLVERRLLPGVVGRDPSVRSDGGGRPAPSTPTQIESPGRTRPQ